MVWGMFKKVVIADRLTVVADSVFSQPQALMARLTPLLSTFSRYRYIATFQVIQTLREAPRK